MRITLITSVNKVQAQRIIHQMEHFIIRIHAVSVMFRLLTVLVQSLFFHSRIKSILYGFGRVEQYFVENLNEPNITGSFMRAHLRKRCICIIAYIMMWIFYIARQLQTGDWSVITVNLSGFMMRASQFLTLLYVIFFTDALAFHIAQLNAAIERHVDLNAFRQKFKRDTIESMLRRLHHYKTIHFELWNIGRDHNAVFGWCTIATLLQAVVDFVYALFWIFDEVKHRRKILRIIFPVSALVYTLIGFVLFSNTCQAVVREVNMQYYYLLFFQYIFSLFFQVFKFDQEFGKILIQCEQSG